MVEQYAFQEFSQLEVENLKTALEEIESELTRDPNKWNDFLDDPLFYLSGFNITLLESFRTNTEIARNFNETAISILKPKLIFNRCLGCKIGVMIFFYALIGQVGYMISISIEMFKTVLDGLEKWFGQTSAESDSLLKKLSALIDHLTISELALTICRHSGHCSYSGQQ